MRHVSHWFLDLLEEIFPVLIILGSFMGGNDALYGVAPRIVDQLSNIDLYECFNYTHDLLFYERIKPFNNRLT